MGVEWADVDASRSINAFAATDHGCTLLLVRRTADECGIASVHVAAKVCGGSSVLQGTELSTLHPLLCASNEHTIVLIAHAVGLPVEKNMNAALTASFARAVSGPHLPSTAWIGLDDQSRGADMRALAELAIHEPAAAVVGGRTLTPRLVRSRAVPEAPSINAKLQIYRLQLARAKQLHPKQLHLEAEVAPLDNHGSGTLLMVSGFVHVPWPGTRSACATMMLGPVGLAWRVHRATLSRRRPVIWFLLLPEAPGSGVAASMQSLAALRSSEGLPTTIITAPRPSLARSDAANQLALLLWSAQKSLSRAPMGIGWFACETADLTARYREFAQPGTRLQAIHPFAPPPSVCARARLPAPPRVLCSRGEP